MHHRPTIGIIATILALSVFSGCGDNRPMTYRTWSNTRVVRVIQFDKATTPESTLKEWNRKNVRWWQDDNHYYIQETDIGQTTGRMIFLTLATAFTVTMDGIELVACTAVREQISPEKTKTRTPSADTKPAAGDAISTTQPSFPIGAAIVTHPIRVVVFAKATTPASETKRWTDADMHWFQDDTHYFVPVTDLGKIVQDVRFRALPEPLIVTVDGEHLEALTAATPWESAAPYNQECDSAER